MPFLLAPLVIPFFAFAAAIILIGLSQTHPSQHGTSGIKGFLDTLIRNSPAAALYGLGKQAASAVVSHFAASQLRIIAKWLLSMGTLTIGTLTGNAAFAEAITDAVERVWLRGDPKARAKAAKAAGAAGAAAVAAHRGIRLGHTNAADLHHYQSKTDARIRPLHHATTVVLPRDIGRVRDRVGPLEREYDNLRGRTKAIEDGAVRTFRWIRAHPNSAAMGVFAGAVAWALARLGYGFLRCRNWQRVGKRLTCGMGGSLADLLDGGLLNLLGMFFAAEAVINFRELVQLGQSVEGEVAKGLHELLNLGK